MIYTLDYIGKWSSGERQMWEKDFCRALIDPTIVNIEVELRNTYALAMKGI